MHRVQYSKKYNGNVAYVVLFCSKFFNLWGYLLMTFQLSTYTRDDFSDQRHEITFGKYHFSHRESGEEYAILFLPENAENWQDAQHDMIEQLQGRQIQTDSTINYESVFTTVINGYTFLCILRPFVPGASIEDIINYHYNAVWLPHHVNVNGETPLYAAANEITEFKDRWEGGLPVATIARIALQLLRGLDELHSQSHWHGQITSDNIIISTDGNVHMVDIDFNYSYLARFGTCDRFEKSFYIDLGSIHDTGVDNNRFFAADIYSLGAVLLYCAWGLRQELIYESNPMRFAFSRGRTGHTVKKLFKSNFPEPLKKFLGAMLNPISTERPSAAELLEHPFLKRNYSPPKSIFPTSAI